MTTPGDGGLGAHLLGPAPSGYGESLVFGAVCTAWDPVTRENTVTDGAKTYTDLACLAPTLMGTGRVLLINTPGRPVILGLLWTPDPA